MTRCYLLDRLEACDISKDPQRHPLPPELRFFFFFFQLFPCAEVPSAGSGARSPRHTALALLSAHPKPFSGSDRGNKRSLNSYSLVASSSALCPNTTFGDTGITITRSLESTRHVNAPECQNDRVLIRCCSACESHHHDEGSGRGEDDGRIPKHGGRDSWSPAGRTAVTAGVGVPLAFTWGKAAREEGKTLGSHALCPSTLQ